jgi:hypothetical protein
MTITGGCLCRAVRYTVSADAIATRVCWCRDCQYFAAGNATVNLVFPAAAVSVTGPLRDYSSIADSGNRMHRRFCERCGTPVTSTSEARPHLTILRAGTLDGPRSRGRPSRYGQPQRRRGHASTRSCRARRVRRHQRAEDIEQQCCPRSYLLPSSAEAEDARNIAGSDTFQFGRMLCAEAFAPPITKTIAGPSPCIASMRASR